MASVQVLCPNGRRQTVKITPNTKLLQVLEEVCTKQNFLPFDDFNLIHGRTTVDLTLAFRFSNLPNNAKLELVKAPQPRTLTDGDVTIAVQLEDGRRLQHTFPSATSLWEVLTHWETEGGVEQNADNTQTPALHPVCIYMREEIIGEHALKYTTLKRLGLTHGKAVIRLVRRPVEQSTIDAIINMIEQEKKRQEKLMSGSSQASSGESIQMGALESDQPGSSVDKNDTPDVKGTEQKTVTELGLSEEAYKNEQESTCGASSETVVAMEVETDAMDVEMDVCQASAVGDKGQSQASAPVEDRHPSSLHRDEPKMVPQQHVPPHGNDEPRAVVQHHTPMLRDDKPKAVPQHQREEAPKAVPQHHSSLHKDESRKAVPQVKPQKPPTVQQECAREEVLYDSKEQTVSPGAMQDVGEDFFEVTESDVRSMYKNLQRQASFEQPLMTEAMRKAKLEQKHDQYDNVILRVQFPDGLVLQGCFGPREKVSALYKFVKDHLEDREQHFYLYVSPPKRVLKNMSETLVMADLAPASLVYFGSDQTRKGIPISTLDKSFISKVSSKQSADEVFARRLSRKQTDTPVETMSSTDVSTAALRENSGPRNPEHDATPQSASGYAAGRDPKMPKWLKLGKK